MFVIPLEVDNPTRHKPFVLIGIVLVNVTIFTIVKLLFDPHKIFLEYGFVPAHFSWLTIVSSMFLHGGVWHLLGNMVFLGMFGDNIEDVVGGLMMAIAYALCGLAATASYLAVHPGSTIPCVGASGAISGMAGMYLTFFPKTKTELCVYVFRWEVDRIPATAIGAIGTWFGEQAVLALVIELTALGGIVRVGFSAHVGGFLMGCLLGVLFLQLGFVRRYRTDGKRHWLLGHMPGRVAAQLRANP